MVTSFKDIPLESAKEVDQVDALLQQHLGISFAECYEVLNQSLQDNAEEVLEEVPNMAPNGDYGLLIEDKEEMIKFLKEEAAKVENWQIQLIDVKKDSQLMELVFFNKIVDDGDMLKGFVFVGLSGKIRHAFVQMGF